jgi:hypothetical protein
MVKKILAGVALLLLLALYVYIWTLHGCRIE